MQYIWNDIGTFHSPGPGFLPFWSGVALGAFSIILIVESILEKKAERKITNLWKGIEWSNVILVSQRNSNLRVTYALIVGS
jgi:hypothetical protein